MKAHTRTVETLGRELRRVIGKHNRMDYLKGGTSDAYYAARSESDDAERLLRYLVQMLDNRHQAVVLASAAGCPGYINYR